MVKTEARTEARTGAKSTSQQIADATINPAADCDRCPRLVAYRAQNKTAYPDYFNGATENFGDLSGSTLILGLAPGLHGANKTGRPFTGDDSGQFLFECLAEAGLTNDKFSNTPLDGLQMRDVLISNAVRCAPPKNRAFASEVSNCRPFLQNLIKQMPNLRVILALGKLAHDSLLRTFEVKQTDAPFGHGASYRLNAQTLLISSYHCSRYNINTRRLNKQMFMDVLHQIKQHRP